MKKRLIAMLLAVVMLLGTLPLNTFAIGVDENGNLRFQMVGNDRVSASLLDGKGDYYEPPVTYKDEDIVRVSIFLKEDATIDQGYSTDGIAENDEAMAYREELAKRQDEIVKAIEAVLGEELDVQWNLTLVANVISANIQYGQIQKVSQVEGVRKVVLESQYSVPESVESTDADPLMTGSSGMTGTSAAWQAGYTGAGMRIAIIDTGLDTDHQSFSGEAFLYALQQNAAAAGVSYEEYVASLDLLDQEEVAAKLDKLHVIGKNKATTADKTYYSAKIPFAFNYVDSLYNYVSHKEDDATDHGSHVAGIATANRYIKKNGQMVDALETVKVAGNAPDAQVIVMKVFGKMGGAYTSDFMAAIEDAIILGCDSINLSLGTLIAGFSDAGDYELIMKNLEKSDTVVAIAAGNEGYGADNAVNSSFLGDGYLYADDVLGSTIGSPGSYTNSMTVASADNAKVTMSGYFKIGSYAPEFSETLYNNMKNFSSLDISENKKGTQYEYVFLDGIGKENEYDFIDVTGKIVICSRGDLAFFEKANIAVSKGAIATIIYNNVSGTIGMDLTSYTHEQPAISITKAVGDKIRALSEQKMDADNNVYYTGTMTICGGQEVLSSGNPYYAMSYFSSWGTTGDLAMKPEITAPGGLIYSVQGQTRTNVASNRYKLNSGTSMASPQVAGIAAVGSQYLQQMGWSNTTNFSIRQLNQSLLMSTAVPMVDQNGNYYPLIQQGAGLVNAQGIVGADSFIMMGSDATPSWQDGKVKAELGDDPNRTGVYTFTFTVYNMSGEEKTYKLDADVFTLDVVKKATNPEGTAEAYYALQSTKPLSSNVTFDVGQQVKVAAGGSSQVQVTIRLTEEGKQWLETYFQKGTYIQSYVFVEPQGDSEGLKSSAHSIPVLAFYGNWTDPSMYEGGSASNGEILSNYSTANTTDYSRYPYAVKWETKDTPNFRYNQLTVINSSGESYTLGGNPLVKDPYYMPERNAIGGSVQIKQWDYSLWRDTALTGTTIENLTTGETYFKHEVQKQLTGTFYDKNNVAWQYGFDHYYVNQYLPQVNDGDMLSFTLYSLPEYYLAGNMGENSQWGSGAEIQIQLNVDAKKPQVSDIVYDPNGALSVTASDNNYIAAVVLYTADGKQVVSYTGSKVQIEKGEIANYVVDTASFGASEYLLQVYDYAMNACTYYLEIDDDAIIYSGALLAYNLETGSWVQLDKYNKTMGSITPETKTYTAAVAVGDTIYAIAYGSELQKLSVSDPSAYQFLGDTGYTLVDIAYNAADKYIYGITDDNKLVRVNPSTGKGTLVGSVPVEANTLACDENGTFYCNQYGTGRIYSFTVNAIRGGDLRYDFNGDRLLNDADSQALMDYLSGKRETIKKLENADIDGDGDVDTYDVYCLFALLPERVNLIAELPANSQYLQSMEIDPNSGALYWASYSTEVVAGEEVSFSVLYGIDVESGAYARYTDFIDQLSCLVVLDKDAGNIYGPLGGVTKLTAADADKRSQYENAVAKPGAIAQTCGVLNTPEAKLLAQQSENTTVEFTADTRTYNGLYIITYDPSIMTLVRVESEADVLSWSDKNGTVTFGFAQNPAVAAGEVVATAVFETDSCDASVEAFHKQANNYRPNTQKTIDTGAHSWGDWNEINAATCVHEGHSERVCVLCGDTQAKTLPIDSASHNWGQWAAFAGPDNNNPGAQAQTCADCYQTRKQWVVDTENNQPQLENVDSYFNYLWVGKAYIDSARISDASVNNVKRIATLDGSIRYIVELSDQTAYDDVVNIKLTAKSITGSGFGQAIRRNPGENIEWQGHELDYTVQLDGGWGQMTAYSYDNSTECTEFHLYFHIGEGGRAYSEPTYIATNDTGVTYDKFVTKLGIWGANVDKFHWDVAERADKYDPKYFTCYVWLSEETDPNGEIDIEFIRERDPEIYLNFDVDSENIAASGTTVKLENGKATLTFHTTPNLPYNPGCVDRYYTIYFRTAINNAPEAIESSGADRIMVGEEYKLDLDTVFQDANGDNLTYTVSINGGEAVAADKNFRYTPTEAGTVTLEFTAFDGFFSSGSYTVTLTVLDEYLAGDVNNDGVVDAKDVTALRRYLAGWDITIQEPSSDMNGDGVVDAKDVTVLRRQLAGM